MRLLSMPFSSGHRPLLRLLSMPFCGGHRPLLRLVSMPFCGGHRPLLRLVSKSFMGHDPYCDGSLEGRAYRQLWQELLSCGLWITACVLYHIQYCTPSFKSHVVRRDCKIGCLFSFFSVVRLPPPPPPSQQPLFSMQLHSWILAHLLKSFCFNRRRVYDSF